MCDWDLLAQKMMNTLGNTLANTARWASQNGFSHRSPNFSSLEEALSSAMKEYAQHIDSEPTYDIKRKKTALIVELKCRLDCPN